MQRWVGGGALAPRLGGSPGDGLKSCPFVLVGGRPLALFSFFPFAFLLARNLSRAPSARFAQPLGGTVCGSDLTKKKK